MSESFSLETDCRSKARREADTARSKQRKWFCLGESDAPMDTNQPQDFRSTPIKAQINPNFSSNITGNQPRQDLFTDEKLFEAVSSGDVNKLQGLEESLCNGRKKLTSSDYCPDGRTVLMKALLHLKNGENKTVEYLLDIAERPKDNYVKELVNVEHKHPAYKGQTALHIAIERRNKHYTELLIQKGADVHARACGTFFQPLGETNFYFGEFPLSLAACTNQKDIVDLLMDKANAKTDQIDTLGNTVLHALVMVADSSPEKNSTDFVISMYDYILTKDAVKNHSEMKLEDIKNKQGLTSIKLAAKLGKIGLLEHILQRQFEQEEYRDLSRMFTEWVYGPVYGSLYDLGSVDTYEPNSVLEIVVYGSGIPNRLEMLNIEPLNKLLNDKWNRFAKWIFLLKFIVYCIYLIIFTAVSHHREEGPPPFPIRKDLFGRLLLTGQIIMALGSVYFICTVVKSLIKRRPSLQTLLIDGYSDLLFLLQAGLFMISTAMYFAGNQGYLALLVLSVALCWINLLYFSRGSQHMGIYNIMIQRIFLGDIMRFLLVYAVFLVGFSAAIVTLLNEPNKGTSLGTDNQNVTVTDPPDFKSISHTIQELFKFAIGMGDLAFTEEYEYKHVFYLLLISYIVLTYILLMNMLIALMSKTVDNITGESTNIWKLQRAICTLDLESQVSCLMKTKWRSGVERNMTQNKQDSRWYLRVEQVWKNWNCKLGEDPGFYNTVVQIEPNRDPNQRDVTQDKDIEEENDPLLTASSSV